MNDVLTLAEKVGLPSRKAKNVAHEIELRCTELLDKLSLTR